MSEKPRHRTFSIKKDNQTLMLYLPFRFAIGAFWPMVPVGSRFKWHDWRRFVWYEMWLRDIKGWTCVCWQIRLLLFGIARCIPIEELDEET